jgi:hypothetical protein
MRGVAWHRLQRRFERKQSIGYFLQSTEVSTQLLMVQIRTHHYGRLVGVAVVNLSKRFKRASGPAPEVLCSPLPLKTSTLGYYILSFILLLLLVLGNGLYNFINKSFSRKKFTTRINKSFTRITTLFTKSKSRIYSREKNKC